MRKLFIFLLCVAGLCCAQLMPAGQAMSGSPEKPEKAEDSLKSIRVKQAVDYSKPVPSYDEEAPTHQAMNKDKMGPTGKALTVKNPFAVAGTLVGAYALTLLTGSSIPMDAGMAMVTGDEEDAQNALKEDVMSPKEQRIMDLKVKNPIDP